MIDGSRWESGLTTGWYCWGRWIVFGLPDLSHCTWLQRVGMIRDDDFMRRWWVACDDRVSWFSYGIDDYRRAFGMGALTLFQRGWYDYVIRMLVFSIDHVRSWQHDVPGCGQMMGGHHFMNLFTLSPSHIELSVASPLSLTRAHSLFFHHLVYLLHRVRDPIVLTCFI